MDHGDQTAQLRFYIRLRCCVAMGRQALRHVAYMTASAQHSQHGCNMPKNLVKQTPSLRRRMCLQNYPDMPMCIPSRVRLELHTNWCKPFLEDK